MRREHSSKIDTASFDFLPEISVWKSTGCLKDWDYTRRTWPVIQ
jgi:hypothetical protein